MVRARHRGILTRTTEYVYIENIEIRFPSIPEFERTSTH